MKTSFLLRTATTAGCLAFFTAAAPAAVLYFDFGDPAAANLSAAPTNNITTAQLPVTNATDSTGSATSISLATSGFSGGSNLNGTSSPIGDAAIFSLYTNATKDNLFGHTQTFGTAPPLPKATLTFSGLDLNTNYTFDFFASRTGVNPPVDVRSTLYSVAGLTSASAVLDATNNTSNIATVAGMRPNASGNITVELTTAATNTNATGFYYIGALRLTTSPVPEPSAAALLGLGLLAPLRRRRRA